MKLADTERKAIIRRTASAIGCLQQGEDAIRVLSRIYCQNLPDKSPRQGQLMAQEVLTWISHFRQAMVHAQEDPEAYVQHTLAEQIADLPLEQQCRVLRRQMLACAASERAEETQALPLITAQQEAAADLEEETVSEAVRDRLLQDAACRITGEKQKDIFNSLPKADVVQTYRNQRIAKTCVGEDMLQAMTAMVIYTMAKNGELSGLPAEVSLAQIVIGVCAEEQHREITCAWESGYLTQAQKGQRYRVVCSVMVTLLITAALVLGGKVLVKGTIEATLSLALQLLLCLSVILGIYYHSAAEMVQEDTETIAQIPLNLNPSENTIPFRRAAPAAHSGLLLPEMKAGQVCPEEDMQEYLYLGQ